jgi:mycofactocin glycosyltransferase
MKFWHAVAFLETDVRPTTLIGRRLDDLVYGAGLWLGALRSRSVRCLTPRLVRSPSSRKPTNRQLQ